MPLLLVACGEDSAAPSPSGSVSVSPSPSAPSATGPAAPELPELAKEKSRDGAETFTWYFFEVANHAMATGDTAPLKAVSDPGCTACSALSEATDRLYAEGRRTVGGGWIIQKITADRSRPMPFRTFVVVVDQPSQRLVDADGKVLETEAHQLLSFRVTARWVEDRWVAYELAEEELPGRAAS